MIFNRSSPTEDGQRIQNQGYLVMLFSLFFLYWLFAHFMERIDLHNSLNQWWQSIVPVFSLPSPIIFLIEMFHPRVLRHLVPIGIGWFLARAAAVSLIQILYDLPDIEHARDFLSNLRSSRNPAGRPVRVNSETLEADREKFVLLRVGGPGPVMISEKEVAVTELDGRFYRVLGPGLHKLELLEYIYAVLDLRQRERVAQDVPLMTMDGIEIKTDITVAYRIDTGVELPTKSRPYPYNEKAAALAAYAETILEDNTISIWEAIPLNTAKALLFQIIARYQLDQILYPRISGIDPHLTIKNELEGRLREELKGIGIKLIRLDIGRFELEEEIIDQYVKYWQTHWETQVQLAQVDGEAFTLEEIEVARAEAEVTMVRAIVEGLQRARLDTSLDTVQEVVALRLIEALEKVAEQSQQSHPLPANLLPELSDLRQQLTLEPEE